MHSDNEKCIESNSEIITLSFGAPRTIKFRSTVGHPTEVQHVIGHGSVYLMSAESQSMWKHGFSKEPEVTDGRISLTFRKMPCGTLLRPETKRPVPPISQVTKTPDHGGLKRVLFVTDSIHKSTPEYLLEGPKYSCVKRINCQLENIDNLRPQFQHADIVVLSCGINDLARYGHTAHMLTDHVATRFREYSALYPTTKFIFNSLLRSRDFKWLNSEVVQFNINMFELASKTRNLFFFDSDRIVLNSKLKLNEIFVSKNVTSGLTEGAMRDSQSNNGLHITFKCKKMVTEQLANAVGYFAGWSGASNVSGCAVSQHVAHGPDEHIEYCTNVK